MAEERVQRRLVAILAADVVGYSRLMELDEAGTLAALKARRKKILQPLVAKHQGRIVKLMGDGVLVEFASAVNAVQCAVDLQHDMAEANGGQPHGRHIVLRVGVNLGDVMVEGDDLYGDGVNIAARLEALAEPGGILVSGTVYDHIKNKIEVGFENLGAQNLKNIAEPVRAYRITGTSVMAVPVPRTATDNPSIAVLPFTNMSGDPGQEYFSDGITEDIITELSRFRSLLVIARNSSFTFKGRAVDAREVGRRLGAQYLVEGSVRKAGNRVRVTAQLLDAATGNHRWAERYDRDLEDIFAVQDEVVHKIAARLEGRLAATIAQRAGRKLPQNMLAYECVVRARQHLGTFDWAAAEPLLRHAITLDPDYAQAHAWMASSLTYRFYFYSDSRTELLDQALKHAQRAVALDENDGLCHCFLAQTQTFRREFVAAGIHFERALALNPADVLTIAIRCRWLICMGRQEEALAGLDEVLLREPFPPSWHWESRAIALIAVRRYREAIEAISRMSRLHDYVHAYLAACHAQLGHYDEARAEAAEVLRMRPDFTIRWMMFSEPFENPADAEPEIEGLRKAGLPE